MNPNVMGSPIPGSPGLSQAQTTRARKGVTITNPNTHEPVVFSKVSTEPTPATVKQDIPAGSSETQDKAESTKKLSFREAILKKKQEAEKAAAEKKAAEEAAAAEKKAAEEAAEKAEAERKAAAERAEAEKKAAEEREAAEKAEAEKKAAEEKEAAAKAEAEKKAAAETEAPTEGEASTTIPTDKDNSEDKINKQIEAVIADVNGRIHANHSAEAKVTSPLHLLEKAKRLSAEETNQLTYPDDYKQSSVHSKEKDVYLYSIDFLYQFQSICVFPPKAQWENVQKRVNIEKQAPSNNVGKGSYSRNNSSRNNFNNDMGKFGMRGERPGPGSNMGGFQMSMNGKPSRMGSVPNLNAMGYKSGRQNSSRRRGNDMPNRSNRDREGSMHNSHMSHRNNRENAPGEGAESEVRVVEEKKEAPPIKRSANAWVPRIRKEAAATEDQKLTPEVVQRKVKSLLNKMTLDNFEIITDELLTISNQSKEEKDGRTLRQVIELTFAKAVDEAHWSNMYARFCAKMLNKADPEIHDEQIVDQNGNFVTGGALFRKYLLSRCQEEFERGWSDALPTNPDGSPLDPELMSDEYYEIMGAKRRGLGLIRFIGELYFLNMLTEKIIHRCIRRLLSNDNPSEEVIESICQLLTTVGKTLDTPENKPHVDVYFDRLIAFENISTLPSRLRFMIMDVVDLRKNGWASDTYEKGPKTVAEIHEEAQAKLREKEREKKRNPRGGRPLGNNNHLSSSDFLQLRKLGSNTPRGDSSFSRENSSRGSRKASAMSSPGISLSQNPSQKPATQQSSTHNPFMALGDDNDNAGHR